MARKESRAEELKRLIKESDEKIRRQNLLIDIIAKDINKKKEEVKSAQRKVESFSPAKILTRKEIEKLKEKKFQELAKKIEEERLNIDSKTKKALERAKKIRKAAKKLSKDKQRSADISALKIEKKAFEKEIKIKTDELHEKENLLEDLLARKVVDKLKVVSEEIRNKSQKAYLKLKNEVDKINIKIFELEREFTKVSEKLKYYGEI